MEGSIFEQSIELMVIGMGMTFSFLIILVGIMKILEVFVNFLNRFFPTQDARPGQSAPEHAALPAADNKTAIAIAIAAAKYYAK